MAGTDAEHDPITREGSAVILHLDHDEGRVTGLAVRVPRADWSLIARQSADGRWQIEGDADGGAVTLDDWPEVFDRLPETVDGVAVRAEVCEQVDREGAIRPQGRSLLRSELTRGLDDFERCYGERDIAAWLAEEAGKRGLRLAADPDMDAEVKGVAYAEASTDPEHNTA